MANKPKEGEVVLIEGTLVSHSAIDMGKTRMFWVLDEERKWSIACATPYTLAEVNASLKRKGFRRQVRVEGKITRSSVARPDGTKWRLFTMDLRQIH